MEVEPETDEMRLKTKARKSRSTDHNVLRIHREEDAEDSVEQGEFVERKTRGKRLKRKATPPVHGAVVKSDSTPAEGGNVLAADNTAEAMDTEAPPSPKKPHFAKLSDRLEMVSVADISSDIGRVWFLAVVCLVDVHQHQHLL